MIGEQVNRKAGKDFKYLVVFKFVFHFPFSIFNHSLVYL